jgi:tungstate transport system permease protein
MHFIWNGLHEAWHLILHPNADLRSIVKVTLQLAFGSTVLALLIGVPTGVILGIGRFRGRRLAIATANGSLGLPPVLVGLVVFLLLWRAGPLGNLNLVYTVRGMIIAQTILNVPIVVAVVAAGAQAVSRDLLDQSRALGASFPQQMLLTMREARVSIMVATIASIGAAFSEVGAVIIVGGNIDLQTRTIAGAILTTVSQGRYSEAIALGVILLGVVLILAAGLTLVQQGGQRARRRVRGIEPPAAL